MQTAPPPRKPSASPFLQQKVRGWRPLVSYHLVLAFLLAIGVSFTPTGVYLLQTSTKVFEVSALYDARGAKTDVDCTIYTQNEGRNCRISFTLTEDVSGPLYVFYALTNFYQNHREYIRFRDTSQLQGKTYDCPAMARIPGVPLSIVENAGQKLSPCGTIANSFFNDVFALDSPGRALNEKDISLASDREYKFKQHHSFVQSANPSLIPCDALLGKLGTKNMTDSSGVSHCYWYPEDASTQYLHETYKQISPLKGVTDEHFIVWMRTASLPTFRKLYGKIEGDFKKGEVLTFKVTANFETRSLRSSKRLVLSTLPQDGAGNSGLGIAFLALGAVCLVMALELAVQLVLCPIPKRRLPDDWQ